MTETNLINNNEVDYFHFDFHDLCKENSDPMLDFVVTTLLPEYMNRIGMFVMRNDIVDEVSLDRSVKTRKIVSEFERFQNGVIRTNCIDCLDRTNVAQ